MSKIAEKKLVEHDGCNETFVCRDCMKMIDPVGGNYPGYTKEQCGNAECPHCGGTDTAWSFEDQECELRVSDLWIDANQGYAADGNAFGFIGTDEAYTDEDGGDAEYCGWFFKWPGERPRINTEDERQAVIGSLETDETERHNTEIPHELAVKKLEAYLDKRFPNLDEDE